MFLNSFWDLITENRFSVIITIIFLAMVICLLVALAVVQKSARYNTKSVIVGLTLVLLILASVTYYLSTLDIKIYKIALVDLTVIGIYALLVYLPLKQEVTAKVNTEKIVFLGVMTGLAVALSFLGFPIIPSFSHLRLEFNGIVYILVLLWFGYGSAITVCLLVNIVLLIFPTGGSTIFFGYDQLINFISCMLYITPVAIILPHGGERKKPKFYKLIISAIIGTVFATSVMVLFNYFITAPLIMEINLPFKTVLSIFGVFNLVKWGAVTIIILLIWEKLYDLKSMVYTR